LADPKLKARLAELGAEVFTGTPEDYGRYLKGEIERWAKVIEFSGAKAECSRTRSRHRRWETEMDDRTVRAALKRHWDASDANDFSVEHEIYHEDAVLDYPQSGERIH